MAGVPSIMYGVAEGDGAADTGPVSDAITAGPSVRSCLAQPLTTKAAIRTTPTLRPVFMGHSPSTWQVSPFDDDGAHRGSIGDVAEQIGPSASV
ncbi:hypothetical protein [Actinoplanes siamensis]|uniref:hypothetical protein n=1 Tax=Actinoplanes siamensis TaxID=1223317 RepID=UPI001940DE5E|nr:hypothetical protein [Actinoplanes siamensis]